MILVAYGTRPEIIKLFPVVHELERVGIPFKTVFTGQQTDLYEDVKDLVPEPDYTFARHFAGENKHNTLANTFIKICRAASELLAERHFSLVIVQGDTTTANALAQMAFFHRIKVAHVEAGLRTFDLLNPYPEEANRSIIAQISDLNFAPTSAARQHLERAGARNVHLVGNTIVDAVEKLRRQHEIQATSDSGQVLVTLHRRENHDKMDLVFDELNCAALGHPYLFFTLPIHPNPNVARHRHRLTAPNIRVINPVGYFDMLRMVAGSSLIITDSGGLQEECSCFCKKVLIVRETTERPEIVEVGLGRLVGQNIRAHIAWGLEAPTHKVVSPFGDGHAAERIVRVISEDGANQGRVV
jgi:UDP-N-acetylglucosamine 2-epimerase